MKLKCVIDTSSCICLSNAEFKQSSLLKWLVESVKISYCREIAMELRDHKDKKLPKFIFDKKLKIRTRKHTMSDYEMRMIGKTIPSRAKRGDKGEIDNFILSVDQIHHLKVGAVIFITDDESALRGVLADWVKSFPMINIWTSYEVVLYLYAEDVIPSKEMALEKIQDIIAITSPKPSERSNKTTQKLIKLKSDYLFRLNKISELIK